MSEQLIPARMNVRRDPVDSVFLQNYAKRLDGRAKWLVAVYALWGGLLGFGLGSAFVAVWGWGQLFRGSAFNFGQVLLGQPVSPALEPVIFGLPVVWIPLLAAGIGAILLGGKGVGRSDEMRFQAQMALHMIRLQDLVKEQSSN